VQCSAVQCSAVQCSAVQCSAVQCSAVQCSAVQCSAPFEWVLALCHNYFQPSPADWRSRARANSYTKRAVQCSAVQCILEEPGPGQGIKYAGWRDGIVNILYSFPLCAFGATTLARFLFLVCCCYIWDKKTRHGPLI
jgi:hypothetical protein